VIAGILSRRAVGERLTESQIRALIDDRREEVAAHEKFAAELSASYGGAVAVIPVVGTIMHRAGGMDDVSGIASTQRLVRRVREAQTNPSIKAIVLDIDSPGGTVDGVAEAAAALREGTKPLVAVANTLAASAAYWLAAQADELVVTPSGEVGSIGVYSMHTDLSAALEAEGVKVTVARAGKYKAERNPFTALSDEAMSEMQAEVSDFYDLFVKDVAKGRGVAPSKVRNGYGEGRTVRAQAAVDAGMADKVATLEETVERLASGGRVKRRAMADVDVVIVNDALVTFDPTALATVTEPTDDMDLRERELGLR
jgi:signal peptide peptidase SppA